MIPEVELLGGSSSQASVKENTDPEITEKRANGTKITLFRTKTGGDDGIEGDQNESGGEATNQTKASNSNPDSVSNETVSTSQTTENFETNETITNESAKVKNWRHS